MWTAICAAGLAEILGDGEAQRLGTCERADCGRVYVTYPERQPPVLLADLPEPRQSRDVPRAGRQASCCAQKSLKLPMSQGNTAASLVANLIEVGVRPGMIVMVHSSLGRVGWTDGGPVTVIRALLEVLGPGGTLVMPADAPTGASD